ncbi:MAG: hypothetical protein KDC48_10520 [Planctomycetes bacterium]|nr:hypothetical protein [Planctomycetota bacterium]
MSRFLIALLFALLLAGVLYIACGAPAGVSPAPDRFDPAPLQRQLDELRAGQRDLEARLLRLEQTVPIARQQVAVVPPVGDSAAAQVPDVEARLADLERAVAQLRNTQVGIGEMPTTVDGIVRALADKNLHGTNVPVELKQRRMELRRRLLELAPQDPRAVPELMELTTDYLVNFGPDRAISLLDEFAVRVGVAARPLALRYASLYSQAGDGDRARQLYDGVVRDPTATEHDRASARFWHAYSFYQQGRYAEAASGFEALIMAYGDDPPAAVKDSVGGARNYLAKCREHR